MIHMYINMYLLIKKLWCQARPGGEGNHKEGMFAWQVRGLGRSAYCNDRMRSRLGLKLFTIYKKLRKCRCCQPYLLYGVCQNARRCEKKRPIGLLSCLQPPRLDWASARIITAYLA